MLTDIYLTEIGVKKLTKLRHSGIPAVISFSNNFSPLPNCRPAIKNSPVSGAWTNTSNIIRARRASSTHFILYNNTFKHVKKNIYKTHTYISNYILNSLKLYTKKKVHAPKIFIFIPQIYIHMFDQQRKSISKGCGSRNFYFKFPKKKK